MRTILCVTDLTPEADRGLRDAARLAAEAGAALHVVHATGIVGLPLREAVEPLRSGALRRAREALEAQVRRTVPPEVGPASCVLDHRGPARAVEALSRQVGADLVVVAAREAEEPLPRGAAGARVRPRSRSPAHTRKPRESRRMR